MDIVIQEIKPENYAEVVHLWNYELGNKNVSVENITELFKRMDDNYKTYVTLYEKSAVGFITTVKVLAAGFPEGYLKINGLAVLQEWQGRGIGTALINHVEKYARENKLSHILLASGFKRIKAHEFYEHRGFDKNSFSFSKELAI